MKCGTAMTVPTPDPVETPIPSLASLLDESPEFNRAAPAAVAPAPTEPDPRSLASLLDDIPELTKPVGQIVAAPAPPKLTASEIRRLRPVVSSEPPLWRRHLHWLLMLALVPLVVVLLTETNDGSFIERFMESLEEVDEADREQILERLEQAESMDEVLTLLPGERLHGALLARSSTAHWNMAVAATIAYMTFFMFLALGGSAKPQNVLFVGLFTATIGVGFLLFIQMLASATNGHFFVGGSIVTIFFLLFKILAFSYSAADDPANGFLLSFIGFTVGVGLCEEFVKALPIFFYRDTESGSTWRGLMISGLASGAGFGIAEGIMYSGTYYNGIHGADIYLVRFLSCVALHAIWTGSVAIFLHQRRESFEGLDSWREWFVPMLIVLAVPAVLHGFYDTCLKKEMNGYALLVALASFAYLAFLLSRLQTVDDQSSHKAMLKDYVRHRSAIS
jgi:RsiW-degrading membrane proteinase PrsW (M82 family)